MDNFKSVSGWLGGVSKWGYLFNLKIYLNHLKYISKFSEKKKIKKICILKIDWMGFTSFNISHITATAHIFMFSWVSQVLG